MFLVQTGYTFLYFITEASFDHGLNSFVYITYRHAVATVVFLPFAYFLERKERPKMTGLLFLEISVLAILGVSLTLNMYFASMDYTSPTFLASMVNTIASLTFAISVVLGLEKVDVWSLRGKAKVAGTLISLGGVMTMTLFKGPRIQNISQALIQIHGNSNIHENWIKGSILTVASCLTFSVWYVMQAYTLRRYPAQLSLLTWMNFLGTLQSAVFAVIMEHKPMAWKIGFNIDFWCIMYSGIVASGLMIYVQLMVTEMKGPVFVSMFNPVSTIMVALLAYFVVGEKLYTGSLIGAVVVIVGLYLLLWGKDKDLEYGLKCHEDSVVDGESKIRTVVNDQQV